ncbi:penicillin-binding protein 1C [Tenacibaculum todarodis]|uniref:peptidoglycan glycosyltransferase n=1 Tax=Tenacibaculum todarodis TaxID=1850252 RepID=A0A1L3JHN9_9FLAO|nr:penicillin-binding protein 1C [Tenacibaculum todarodis]APG64622.1 penicillin-binding protein 1C [Tenacibaculum todarodis]
MEKLKNIIKTHPKKLIVLLVLLVAYYFCLPKKLFNEPTSTVVLASNNELLGAVIADDGQWRFPKSDSIPIKFQQAIVQFEDAHFYKHVGFNPISIYKAFQQNRKAGKVVRGGSTLTQQVIRLSRKNKKRSYIEKLKEVILATRLEFRHSKKEILNLYASNAPFGGNVVGLEMASWRYFGLKPAQLSWAESATLAVLPNAPSLIYPGKNQQKLKVKRNKLLHKLYKEAIIDSITLELALAEELPQKPYRLPTTATHLTQEISKKYKGNRIETSLDIHLQKQVNQLVKRHYNRVKQNEVFNMAVLVLDVKTRKVLAYVGNSPTDKKHQKNVNNILSRRSTGSVLKPFLYASMLQSGDLLPQQLVSDIPTEIAGYTPKNFNEEYDGAVPANEALTRSLNIPAVRMLQRYGLEKFREDLKEYNINHIDRSANHYGLSLILGGAEASLWDLCKTFAGMSSTVNHFEELKHQYYSNEFVEPTYFKNKKVSFGTIVNQPKNIDAGSWFLTLETLTNVNRVATDQAWKYYDSAQKIAWKTGTSFGNRDAWAIGTNANYVVGVWVGNSDGEGRADLTGVGSASPLLFNVFNLLPKSDWFLEPFEALIEEDICTESGYLALPICPSTKKRIPQNGLKSKSCPYHKEILLSKDNLYRVTANCEDITSISKKTWFSLPALMAYYYKQNNADYRQLPRFKTGCNPLENNTISFIFPKDKQTKVSLTKGFDGKTNPVVFKLVHNNTEAKVYWYLNDEFLKMTENYHEIAVTPKKGKYTLTVIDDLGNEVKKSLEIN